MDPLPRYYITPEMLAAENCRRGRKRNFCVTEKIQPALNRPLRQRLKRYAKNYGMSETEIVTLALAVRRRIVGRLSGSRLSLMCRPALQSSGNRSFSENPRLP